MPHKRWTFKKATYFAHRQSRFHGSEGRAPDDNEHNLEDKQGGEASRKKETGQVKFKILI